MAPNKFEKHLKKQLKEREIQPSANAWERLSEKLDASVPQSKKRNYFWYGIAASFIGVLVITVLYFSSEGPVNTTNIQVVETNDEAIEAKTNVDIKEQRDIEEVIVGNNKIKLPISSDVGTIDENPSPELKDQITSVEEIDTVIDRTVEKMETSNYFREEIINIKISEIVAAIDSLQQNDAALTEAEVDNLLRNAQEEILRDKLFKQNGSVDAMALLTEVEDELDQSFRDQIFESLKTGFLKVRTAVADRNK